VHRNKTQVQEIISRQLSEEERKAKADYNIINDGSKLVIPQVSKLDHIINKLRSLD
jgi:dephospho-CoA kinase